MKPILVLLPSKERPQKIEGFYQTWRETTEGYSDVICCLDEDDLTINDYKRHKDILYDVGAGKTMCGTINRVFYKYPDYKYYFIVSDDHRIRTKYWETRLMEIIEKSGGTGVAYGNDLLYGKELSTSAFVSGNIFRCLGYIALPGLYHMWIDRFWMELGKGLGKLFYFPDIFIEHMHFTAKKSVVDSSYLKVNNKKVYAHDEAVFRNWQQVQETIDLKSIQAFKD